MGNLTCAVECFLQLSVVVSIVLCVHKEWHGTFIHSTEVRWRGNIKSQWLFLPSSVFLCRNYVCHLTGHCQDFAKKITQASLYLSLSSSWFVLLLVLQLASGCKCKNNFETQEKVCCCFYDPFPINTNWLRHTPSWAGLRERTWCGCCDDDGLGWQLRCFF